MASEDGILVNRDMTYGKYSMIKLKLEALMMLCSAEQLNADDMSSRVAEVHPADQNPESGNLAETEGNIDTFEKRDITGEMFTNTNTDVPATKEMLTENHMPTGELCPEVYDELMTIYPRFEDVGLIEDSVSSSFFPKTFRATLTH
jgi:hypothetical protein